MTGNYRTASVCVLGECPICGRHSSAPLTRDNDCERCRLVWTVQLAKKTRAAQQRYFSERTGSALNQSKEMEMLLDKALDRLLNTQPSLIDEEG